MATGLKYPCETCKRNNTEYKQRGLCRCPAWKQYFREEWKEITLSLREYPDEIKRILLSAIEEEKE